MAKIKRYATSPDDYSPNLQSRSVGYNPLHAELIGDDPTVELMYPEGAPDGYQSTEIIGYDPISQNPYVHHEIIGGRVYEMPVTDGDGSYNDVEPFFSGEVEDEHEEGTEPGDVDPDDITVDVPASDETEAPEDSGSDNDDVSQMPPEADVKAPGQTQAVRAAPVSPFAAHKAAQRARRPAKVLKPVPAKKLPPAFQFAARLHAYDPKAIRTLKTLAVKAKTSPRHASMLRGVAKLHAGLRGRVHVGGFVSMGERAVPKAASYILKVVLTPAAWVAEGAGTLTQKAGDLLVKLSRSL